MGTAYHLAQWRRHLGDRVCGWVFGWAFFVCADCELGLDVCLSSSEDRFCEAFW